MTAEKQRRAFISYSRINKEFATKLTKELRSAGYPVWFDQLDIPTGSRWDDEVEKALRECSIFLIILTPASIASENVKDEIGYAIDHGKRILPILLENCDVPLRLRRFQYVDFTNKNFQQGLEGAKELLRDLVEEASIPVAVKEGGFSVETKPEPAKVKPAPAAPIQKKPTSMGLVIGVVAVVALVIAGIGYSALSSQATATPATEAPLIGNLATEAPTEIVNLPTPTVTVVVEIESTATAVPIPTLSPYHVEDFDSDAALSNWDAPLLTSGTEDKLNLKATGGNLAFEITAPQVYAYLTYKGFEYTDVRIDAVAVNLGVNTNNISLLCRYSERGWYEFNVYNDGRYDILAYTKLSNFYDTLASGGSNAIKTGQATNKYTVICEKNTLTLLINDEKARTASTAQYSFEQGKIGVSVSSGGQTPVSVQFQSVTISKP